MAQQHVHARASCTSGWELQAARLDENLLKHKTGYSVCGCSRDAFTISLVHLFTSYLIMMQTPSYAAAFVLILLYSGDFETWWRIWLDETSVSESDHRQECRHTPSWPPSVWTTTCTVRSMPLQQYWYNCGTMFPNLMKQIMSLRATGMIRPSSYECVWITFSWLYCVN